VDHTAVRAARRGRRTARCTRRPGPCHAAGGGRWSCPIVSVQSRLTSHTTLSSVIATTRSSSDGTCTARSYDGTRLQMAAAASVRSPIGTLPSSVSRTALSQWSLRTLRAARSWGDEMSGTSRPTSAPQVHSLNYGPVH
jgi:hypothetical protein